METYLEQMKAIQGNLLQFLDDSNNTEENYQNLIKLFDDQKIRDNQHKLKSLLHLLTKISNNHHRQLNFFDKIDQIIKIFKADIKNFYSNYEIFNIFKSNKRILLYLIEEEIMHIDKSIVHTILTRKYKLLKYPEFFFNEIKQFNDQELNEKIQNEISENFEEWRKIGENDNYICQLIRNDSIDEFISFLNQTKTPISTRIEPSIYETNKFLMNRRFLLIEYAAFFGSFQIFKYLFHKKAKFSSDLWLYAIHGQNFDIFHLIEENNVRPKNDSFEDCFIEAIKCHHNEVMKYINENLLQSVEGIIFNAFLPSVKYYNFVNIQDHFIKESEIFELCKCDYFILVNSLLKDKSININEMKILKNIFNAI